MKVSGIETWAFAGNARLIRTTNTLSHRITRVNLSMAERSPRPARHHAKSKSADGYGYRRGRRAGLSYLPGRPAHVRSNRLSRIFDRINSETTPKTRSMARIIGGHQIGRCIYDSHFIDRSSDPADKAIAGKTPC